MLQISDTLTSASRRGFVMSLGIGVPGIAALLSPPDLSCAEAS